MASIKPTAGLGVALGLVLLSSCAGMEPAQLDANQTLRDIPKGPGLFSRAGGSWGITYDTSEGKDKDATSIDEDVWENVLRARKADQEAAAALEGELPQAGAALERQSKMLEQQSKEIERKLEELERQQRGLEQLKQEVRELLDSAKTK